MNHYLRIYNKTFISDRSKHFKSLFMLEMTLTCRLLVEEEVEEEEEEVVVGPWREETMNSGRSRFPHPEEETHNAVTQTVQHSGRKGLSLGLYQICEILDPVRHPLLPERWRPPSLLLLLLLLLQPPSSSCWRWSHSVLVIVTLRRKKVQFDSLYVILTQWEARWH